MTNGSKKQLKNYVFNRLGSKLNSSVSCANTLVINSRILEL